MPGNYRSHAASADISKLPLIISTGWMLQFTTDGCGVWRELELSSKPLNEKCLARQEKGRSTCFKFMKELEHICISTHVMDATCWHRWANQEGRIAAELHQVDEFSHIPPVAAWMKTRCEERKRAASWRHDQAVIKTVGMVDASTGLSVSGQATIV